MTDFRFHVVSLAAVLVALAVGVVLGSGPMRTAVVGEIGNEVERLESELSQSQAQLDAARDQSEIGESFVDQAAPLLIEGTLTDARVALVLVNGPDSAAVDAQRDLLVQAGGTVVSTTALSPSWVDPGQAAFRAALAEQMVDNVVGVEATQSPDRVLAHALAQALMPSLALADVQEDDLDLDTGFPDADSATDRSAVLTDLLTEADLVDATLTDGADAVVLIVGDVQGEAAEDAGASSRVSQLHAQLAGILAEYEAAVVVAGGAQSTEDVPTAVQNQPDIASTVSSVTDALSHFGRYATVLALAEQRTGGQGHYGPGPERQFVP